MTWETYDLELLTWTFTSGADQTKAEIRVPSIRGEVRWWFRALGGTPQEERTIFGGVHQDSPTASSVAFRLRQPIASSKAVNTDDLQIKMGQPLSYLLFPLRPIPNRSDQRRGLISPGTPQSRFQLQVRFRRSVSPGLERRFRSAVEAWILLGGLGSRNRRGMGSLWLHGDLLDGIALDSLDSFGKKLRSLAEQNRRMPRVMTLGPPAVGPEGWKEALKRAEFWLRSYRTGSSAFGQTPSKWGKNDHDGPLGRSQVLYRPVLGLPLEQRFRGGEHLGFRTKHERFGDRWASPLHLKVVRCGREYHPLAIFFPEHAMREGDRVRLQPTGRQGGQPRLLPVSRELFLTMMREVPRGGRVLSEGKDVGRT